MEKPEEKSYGWTAVGSPFAGTYDVWNSKPSPSVHELIKAFDDIPYACARLISQKLANACIKLFVKTAPGQPRPKCLTRCILPTLHRRIYETKRLTRGTNVEEVLEHPALDLLHHGNVYHNFHELMEYTDLYLSISGNAYWLVIKDRLELPASIALLPSQLITPERDASGAIRKWKLRQGSESIEYDPADIIHFRLPSLLDPYGLGMSPLQAAWQRVIIGLKELGYIDSTLENQGRPDIIISPKDETSVVNAERLTKDYYQRFQGPGAGGPLVVDGTIQVTPLNYAPKDMWELSVYKEIKTSVCNCFLIPPDLFELGVNSNRSTREAAIYSLAEDCIKPRVQSIVAKLNERLLSMYGEDRLFFDAEHVVPADKEFDLREVQMLLQTQCITRDEVRTLYGFASEDWAKEPLLPSGVMPAVAPVQDGNQAEELFPVDRSTQAPAIAGLQQSYYAGQLPREACLAQARLVFGFAPDEAEALFPAVQPVKLTPDDQPPGPPGSAPGPGPAAPELPGDGKAVKCGGEGGKPGPCPEAGADEPAAAKPSGQHLEKVNDAVDKLGDEIGDDPEAQQTARTTFQKVTDGLKAVALGEFPAWACDTCDLWLFEDLMGKQGEQMTGYPGAVLAVKAAAWGAAKAYLGVRKLMTGKGMKADDDLAGKVLQVMKIVGEAGGFNVPSLDELKQRLEQARHGGGHGNQDHPGGNHSAGGDNRGGKAQVKCLEVPDVRQEGNYDCGAAATASVCKFFGVGPDDEADYIEELGTTPQDGTNPPQIVAYLDSLGLVVQDRQGMTVADLRDATASGSPVLCCIQDYEDSEAQLVNEQSGHWVIVCGIHDEDPISVILQDPSAGRVEMPAREFLARWEDNDEVEDGRQAEYVHYGIIVSRPQGKAVRKKALRRKSPDAFAQALQRFFRVQARSVQSRVKALDNLDIHAKALPHDWLNLDEWTEAMYAALRPVVALYFDYSAKETVARIGGSRSLLHVVQPKLRDGVDKATLLFCEETNRTTSMELNAALRTLREELAEGLEAGDVKQAMMARVKTVFDQAENLRAWRIAVTEASRAQHAAQQITAVESGLVKGKRWILSEEACPECQKLAGKVVGIEENFTTVEGNPAYSDIPYPPLHPHCRCDMIEVVEEVND